MAVACVTACIFFCVTALMGRFQAAAVINGGSRRQEYVHPVSGCKASRMVQKCCALTCSPLSYLRLPVVVASSDLNPISTGYLASPAAITRLKILTAKALFVIASDDLQGWPKPQAIIIIFTVAMICWWNFRRVRH